jgi:SMC interacting uncharacterized protein involved in chromosome segregation
MSCVTSNIVSGLGIATAAAATVKAAGDAHCYEELKKLKQRAKEGGTELDKFEKYINTIKSAIEEKVANIKKLNWECEALVHRSGDEVKKLQEERDKLNSFLTHAKQRKMKITKKR